MSTLTRPSLHSQEARAVLQLFLTDPSLKPTTFEAGLATSVAIFYVDKPLSRRQTNAWSRVAMKYLYSGEAPLTPNIRPDVPWE